jgi:hypothetical protein
MAADVLDAVTRAVEYGRIADCSCGSSTYVYHALVFVPDGSIPFHFSSSKSIHPCAVLIAEIQFYL